MSASTILHKPTRSSFWCIRIPAGTSSRVHPCMKVTARRRESAYRYPVRTLPVVIATRTPRRHSASGLELFRISMAMCRWTEFAAVGSAMASRGLPCDFVYFGAHAQARAQPCREFLLRAEGRATKTLVPRFVPRRSSCLKFKIALHTAIRWRQHAYVLRSMRRRFSGCTAMVHQHTRSVCPREYYSLKRAEGREKIEPIRLVRPGSAKDLPGGSRAFAMGRVFTYCIAGMLRPTRYISRS